MDIFFLSRQAARNDTYPIIRITAQAKMALMGAFVIEID
jgi:hypothetical protein